MSISHAVLMCHAPIVVPEVGGRRSDECAKTTAAMKEAACFIVDGAPDVLVILSPHTQRARTGWCIVDGEALFADFSRFRVPECTINLPNAVETVALLHTVARSRGLETVPLPTHPLDHGAAVPLHFLCQAGWSGPTVVIALPWSGADEVAMGEVIRTAAQMADQRWAIVASGDMSHRLAPGAPAGFDPRAKEFDQRFTELITAGELRAAFDIDSALRELAAEDVVQTTAVASAAVDWDSRGHRTLCYEGPFGVGYLEAVLHGT
ncbi:MAG: hypothetical protein HN348_19415 [Proteobacteria bacterium]|nr:hypothetical protein [Pseudomonadota bacterium]